MKNDITPKGKISPKEGLKCIRDAFIVSIGGFIPQVIEILQIVDFGEYSTIASIAMAMFVPLINRYFNIVRV